MMQLARGQKAKISDVGGANSIEVAIHLASRGAQTFDVSCFGLDSDGRLSNDQYFIFYNQKRSPEGAIEMVGSRYGARECFKIELSRIPSTVRRLVFTGSIDGNGTMADLDA